MHSQDTRLNTPTLSEVAAGTQDPLFSACLLRDKNGHLVLLRYEDDALRHPGRMGLFRQEVMGDARISMVDGLHDDLDMTVSDGSLARLGTIEDEDGAVIAVWCLLDPVDPQQLRTVSSDDLAVVDPQDLNQEEIMDEVRWAMRKMFMRAGL